METSPATLLEVLEARIRAILPEEYQDTYEDVKPVSMGSAGLTYGEDGRVAWDEIWDTFCDLAMAGGPPHKGKLLEPGSIEEIAAQPERYAQIVAEICRGITLVTQLEAEASVTPGWVRVECGTSSAAEWLVRAIVMENVSARCEGTAIELPVGPGYRIEKEVKNVITSIAKTSHYWFDHMWPPQQQTIGNLFVRMNVESPLVQPGSGDDALREKIGEAIQQATGLRATEHRYAGWLGVECADVRAAIWMMRALVVSNVLARREGTVLFVAVNEESDPRGERVAQAVSGVYDFAKARRIISS